MSGSRKGLFGDISSLPEVPNWKIDVCIAQGEERHPKDYFRTDISYQEGLFKESYSICLVHHWEGCDYHFMGIQHAAVDFLGSNICWLNREA